MTTLLPALAGANTIYGAGMLELGMTFSMEQLVIDNDIFGMVKKAMQGIPVSDETLSVESIQKVGVGNNFFFTCHFSPPEYSKLHTLEGFVSPVYDCFHILEDV
jgi:trimethylamine:corrinoid methyltransferase-like protein